MKTLRDDETIISSISVTDIFFDVYLGKWNYRAIPKVKTWSYFLTIPKQKINSRNSQAEYLLSNAQEEVKKEIDRIGERLRNQGEVCVLSEADKEELFKKIRKSCDERVKNPYFQRYFRGFNVALTIEKGNSRAQKFNHNAV